MQKVLSFLVVATLATPLTFAASGETPTLTPTLTVSGANPVPARVAEPAVVNSGSQTVTPVTTTVSPTISLGEAKSVSCSSNPAFATNSCNQCFDGGTITTGKKLTGLFDNWTNTTSSLLIAYQGEQKTPNMISFGATTWTPTPSDETKMWQNGSDIVWQPTQSGSAKMQFILPATQKVRFIESTLGAGYTLTKTDRKNGELVGMMKYPVTFHTVDGSGNEGGANTHYECVSYTLSAPTVTPTTPEKKPTSEEITKPQTGPTETIVLILAAFFIAFGLMFSLRKRI